MSTKDETTKKPGHITLLKVRCSYLKIITASAVASERNNPDARKRYDLTILIPKDDKVAYGLAKGEVDRIVLEKKKAGVTIKKVNQLLKDGDDSEANEDYRGYWYFTASRQEAQGPPPVYGRKKAEGEIKPGHKDWPYSGCDIHAKVGIFHTNKGGDKVCASIELIKFAGDNTPLGDKTKASADDLPDDEDESDGLDDELPEDEDDCG